MDICCFSNGLLSFFTYVILTNVSNGANFCMKLPYFMKEISIFAPKPCILRNLRSKRERSGFSLLNLTAFQRVSSSHNTWSREHNKARMFLRLPSDHSRTCMHGKHSTIEDNFLDQLLVLRAIKGTQVFITSSSGML